MPIKSTIIKRNLPPSDLHELKELYFRNIGTITLNITKNMSKKELCNTDLFDLSNPGDSKMLPDFNNLDFHRACIYFSKFNEFRKEVITKNRIQYYNENRNKKFGIHS